MKLRQYLLFQRYSFNQQGLCISGSHLDFDLNPPIVTHHQYAHSNATLHMNPVMHNDKPMVLYSKYRPILMKSLLSLRKRKHVPSLLYSADFTL